MSAIELNDEKDDVTKARKLPEACLRKLDNNDEVDLDACFLGLLLLSLLTGSLAMCWFAGWLVLNNYTWDWASTDPIRTWPLLFVL